METKGKSSAPGAQQIIDWSVSQNLETCFDRAQKMKPCPIGKVGSCCKVCNMGPCRLTGKDAETEMHGVCGATLSTIAARNFCRMIAAGTSAHSDHARGMVETLLAVCEGHAPDFQIKDVAKLHKVAGILGIETGNRPPNDIGKEVALTFLNDFGRQQGGEINYARLRAPKKTLDRWRKNGIVPRSIDREVVEMMHRTNIGVDHDPDHLLTQGLRTALADGWGGCMISTDITDILFGTPKPIEAEGSFGIFKEKEVNIVVHGHEPLLAEMIYDVVNEPEMIAYSKSKGAEGINLGGMCCTANEILIRHGIPTAGGFTNQELGILTGLVDLLTVDVQCIMPAITQVSKKFHTKVITTNSRAKMQGAEHIQFDEHHAKEIARRIVTLAIDNYPNRTTKGEHITEKFKMIAGFSHEYIEYMQGGKWRGSFRPLNDAIAAGRVRGVVGLAGCDNPRVDATSLHKFIATELIKRDVLVVTTGCGAGACGSSGYLTPEMALEQAGPGLREVCEAIGIPPILHLGACVDNSRILTIASAMAAEGGLSDEIGGMPAVGIAPEWMSEKAIAIGCYFAASGVPVIFGGQSPVEASKEVTKILTETWFERYMGSFHFEPDQQKMLDLALDYIDKARANLKLKKWVSGSFGTEKVLMDMAARRELEKVAKPHLGI